MVTKALRLEQLLRSLDTAARPLPGHTLASLLDVTDRSIRSYVKELNDANGEELIRSTPSGYQLDRRVYRKRREREVSATARPPTDPRARLHELTRRLVTGSVDDVYALADELCVSQSTLETDLGRARLLLRDYDLALVRKGARVQVTGPERQRRRLMRHVILAPSCPDLETGPHRRHLEQRRELTHGVRRVLANFGISLNEYVLLDLCTHLYIALEGVPVTYSGPTTACQDLAAAARAVTAWVDQWAGRALPVPETDFVLSFLMVSTHHDIEARGLDLAVFSAVRDCVIQLDDHFLLRLYDGDDSLVGLALHIQDMIGRLHTGQDVERPFGSEFQLGHPLVHELTIYFIHALEQALAVEVPQSETDFLALHLGSRLQRLLEAEQHVTITVVVPRFGSVADDAVRRLSAGLQGLAVVERLVTEIDAEVSRRPSDIVVTAVPLVVDPSVPVVTISPLCTRHEVDVVRQTVLEERQRAQRHQVWSALLAFTDESLYLHTEGAMSQDEALRTCHSMLMRVGAVDEGHLADVLDRERRSSTAFGGRFAMPHSMYMDARRTALAILTSSRAIGWGQFDVNLVIMMAVSPRDRAVFRDVLDELVRILSDPAGVDALLLAGASYGRLLTALRAQTLG